MTNPWGKVINELLFLAGLFLLNFTARVIFSPLLPVIEEEFAFGHAAAGSFFLLISAGYFLSILLSGFVSARITHQGTIVLSIVAAGIALVILSFCTGLFLICIGLFCLGLAAGLYLPSGLATIMQLVAPAYLARGMAVHELAPNLGFIVAPMLADLMLRYSTWHQGLLCLGLVLIGAGVLYKMADGGSHQYGTALSLVTSQAIMGRPGFWLITVLFSLAICSSLGVYAMLPLFMVSGLEMAPEYSSRLLAVSRIAALLMPLAAGWFGDRFGNKMVLTYVLLLAGFCTLLLGVLSAASIWLIVLIIVQPMITVCFFPSGFAVLSALGNKEDGPHSIALCIPVAFLVGGGVMPAVIGIIGDHFSLGAGFVLTGIIMIAGAALSFFVAFDEKCYN